MKLRFTAFLAFAALSLPALAFADESRTSWWVEGRPWPCTSLVAPLAEELALLCDASGAHCSIARSEAQATRRAVLYCERADAPGTKSETWVLEAQNEKGERLWSVNLVGEEPERLHQGAMWIARAEGGEPVAPPPHAPVVKPGQAPARDAVNETKKGKEPDTSGGLSIASHGVIDPYARGMNPGFGARIEAALLVTASMRGAISADATFPSHNDFGTFRKIRGAAGASWGAPWTNDVLGTSLMGGVAAVMAFEQTTKFVPFGEARLVAQVPSTTVRPFLAFGVTVSGQDPDYGYEQFSTGLDLGLAWSAW